MIKIIIGIALGLCIGAACRYFEVPVPAPPTIIGAVLVVAMTVGYLGVDRLMSRHTAMVPNSASTASRSGASPGN